MGDEVENMKHENFNTFEAGEQPCKFFNPTLNEWDTYEKHECPVCGKTRVFCKVCCIDHHEGGWQDCWAISRAQKLRHSFSLGDDNDVQPDDMGADRIWDL